VGGSPLRFGQDSNTGVAVCYRAAPSPQEQSLRDQPASAFTISGDRIIYSSRHDVIEIDATTGAVARRIPFGPSDESITAPVMFEHRGAIGIAGSYNTIELVGFPL
jgi:hypothetical protein